MTDASWCVCIRQCPLPARSERVASFSLRALRALRALFWKIGSVYLPALSEHSFKNIRFYIFKNYRAGTHILTIFEMLWKSIQLAEKSPQTKFRLNNLFPSSFFSTEKETTMDDSLVRRG